MGNFQKKWCVKKRFFGNLFKAKEFFRLFTPESFSDRGTGGGSSQVPVVPKEVFGMLSRIHWRAPIRGQFASRGGRHSGKWTGPVSGRRPATPPPPPGGAQRVLHRQRWHRQELPPPHRVLFSGLVTRGLGEGGHPRGQACLGFRRNECPPPPEPPGGGLDPRVLKKKPCLQKVIASLPAASTFVTASTGVAAVNIGGSPRGRRCLWGCGFLGSHWASSHRRHPGAYPESSPFPTPPRS